jgi:histidinol-phosphate phosphatase family protein
VRRAVFLDRDGVINRKAPPHQYIVRWGEFEFLPHVVEAITDLNRRGFLVIVVSNQRGIARGVLTREKLDEIHARMSKELRGKGAVLDGIYYCPHDYSDNCACRKPRPGMLFEAAKDLNIDLYQSFIVGDSEDDIAAGKAAGCRTILINPSGGIFGSENLLGWSSKPDRIIADLGGLGRVIAEFGTNK